MKQFFRVNILTGILIVLCISAWSQVPFEINYQGIARDLNGTLLSGQDMRVRISLYDQNPSGNTVYSETKKVTTNKWGLFTIGIGNDAGLITRTGKLSSVDWSVNAKFIGVEIDPNGSNQFIQLGTTQLLSVPYSLYSLKSKDGVPPVEGQSHKVLTNDGNQAFWDTIIIPKYQAGDGIAIKGNTIEVTKEALLNATRIHNIPIDISSLQNGGILCWDEKNNRIVFDKKRLPGDGLRLEENTLHIQDTSIFNASKIMDVPVDIQNKQDGFVLAWDKSSNSFKLIPRLIAQEGLAFDGNNLSIRDTAVFNAARIMDIPVDTLQKQEGFVLGWDKASNSFKLIPRLVAQEGLTFDGNNLSIRDTAVFNAARIMDIPVDTLQKQEGFVLGWDKASNSFKLIPRLIAQEGLTFDGNNLSIRDTAVFNAARIMDIPVDTLQKQEGFVLGWDKASNSFKLIPRLIAQEGLAFDGNNLSIRDTAVFNAARIMGFTVDTAALANGAVLSWNSSERKLQFNPQISAGTGLILTDQTLHIKDEPIFNAGKIANYAVDSNGKTDGDVIFWDSTAGQYRHRSVDSLFDRSQILTQEGNSFGTEVVIGTQDSFGIDFKINNQVIAQLKKTGEFNVDYIKPNKQFIAPAKFHPLDPVRLYNGDISYNGEWLPPIAFEEDPKTGIALEDMEATAMTLVNKGRPLLRTYWEGGIVDQAAILHGFGTNRLTIQSESNMVHIAKKGRFEWESFIGNYLDFAGYTAASYEGKTIRFTTEPLHPATPVAIMPFGSVNALEIMEGEGNINSVFDHDGWLGINTDRPMAPLHIRNRRTSSNTTLAILENNLGEEVFTAANDRTSFFGGKAFYRAAPLFNEEDSNSLVNKKYVDDRIATFQDQSVTDSNEIHTLVDPEITLESYTLSFPANPRNGMECYFYFGGKITNGTVVRTLQLAEGVNNVLLSSSLPVNVPAGDVIGFRWFESSSKWYRKE